MSAKTEIILELPAKEYEEVRKKLDEIGYNNKNKELIYNEWCGKSSYIIKISYTDKYKSFIHKIFNFKGIKQFIEAGETE